MPKGKRRDRGRRVEDHSDEEFDASDNASVLSSASDNHSVCAEGGAADGEVDEVASQEDFEDKLKDVIDGLVQKSLKGRCSCLTSLKQALSKKYVEEFVSERRLTILDALEKNLKKGKGEERALASHCAVLVMLQLGVGPEADEVFSVLRPTLVTIMTDASASLKARAACAFSVGLLAFLSSGETMESYNLMQSLETIFRASFYKGDGTPPAPTAEVAHLHASALSSWALLLTISPSSVFNQYLASHMKKLMQLLDSPDVDLRITAGETIALMYDIARSENEYFKDKSYDSLCEKLKELATDSNKHRAKKDRRQQRSSFRDILHAVEDGEEPTLRIRFGIESLEIDSWTKKKHYDTICHSIGVGTQVHLQENPFVREIFDLGEPIPTTTAVKEFSKRERQYFNAEAFKARTKARSKHRDKRNANFQNGY